MKYLSFLVSGIKDKYLDKTHLVKLVNTTDLKSVPFGLPVQFRQWVISLNKLHALID
jgi:hypothetical protein